MINARMREYRKENPDKFKEIEKNRIRPDSYKDQLKHYRETHKEEVKQKQEEYKPRRNELRRERLINDHEYKILENYRTRIWQALNGKSKSAKTIDLLGCSVEFFKNWLEYQFYDNMSWDNHGKWWHIDHVIPCASFDLSDPDQQKTCFNWRNLAPLRADKNISKSDKRDIFSEVLQELKVKVYLSLFEIGEESDDNSSIS
jgi:hypothetical protein